MKIKRKSPHRHRPDMRQTEDGGWNEDMVRLMLSNPFYCLEAVDPVFCEPHPVLIPEEEWIQGAVKSIEREGAESFIRGMLQNLKGGFVRSDAGVYGYERKGE
jgi:hypothetical protein